MNSLPLHLLDDILFRLEPKSVALMRCTSSSINSHICEDPVFETEYFSRFGSSLYNLSAATGASEVFCHPLVSSCKSMSLGKRTFGSYSFKCFILGSCSGLLLLYIDGLFVVNPLTKEFRFLDCSGSKFIPTLFYGLGGGGLCFLYKYAFESMCVGFAVDGIRTNKRFKIVCILEMQTRYEFEISDGDSWRLSKTSITAGSKSDLMKRTKPVYLHGTLHWLRKDGSIIAFDPETEQARFIPSTFHPETEQARIIPSTFHHELSDMELLFAADDKTNRLTLIVGTKKTISVYILLENSKWIFVRQFKNVTLKTSIRDAGTWFCTMAIIL
ncbi:PREDICTED: LOW QUALITY PROTEIN: F-box protein At1g20360-like [Camelina sativa]|uniref:LOW QUALITY PROTEIN: F-box protein At1g20360-like n=1 Tax=Camelina sativa TaxID=90675 RepID=A0ABM0Y596_CAMSA|nr:PREDICTED: LOW QUALITY PROTEIN: F-box protein At1g20360-like [Camelina sativa]